MATGMLETLTSSSARRRALAIVAVLLVLAALGVAHATVTQVDGTIIPETSRLQDEFDDLGEPLDAILDAAEVPEVFLPNTAEPVVFTDLAEGAGFENSFGWYNVGDDVFTPEGRARNLHPIMGCGSPMVDAAPPALPDTEHRGNPAFYVQDAEPGDTIAVDFAAEQTAGRYKGGFIGFWLITPEGRDSGDSNNCGDFLARADVFFGFIYFTQKDLNDDGDFVHHLVYTSGLDPDRFYFGFEDLFRGGDNDFEDMAMIVDGLTPPCTPAVEVCDGIDNDCDGLIDADDPDITGVGDACICDGDPLECNGGPVFGECLNGTTVCEAGTLKCEPGTGSPEVCDGLDNNCNAQVDENVPGTGAACDGPDADLCEEGVLQCVGGAIECSDDTGPNLETCDGADQDCDGDIDEDLTDEGATCGSDVGECSPGVEVCVNGTLECQGEVGGTDEVCDGLDNNCNGVDDDNPVDVGVQCGDSDVGNCEFGVTICNGGVVECAGEVGPVPETCNLQDDDCDGVDDNDPVDVGGPCGISVGVCEPGVIICTATGPECDGEVTGSPEECNGLDDDCNGLIDDNPAGENETCGETAGICEPGLTKCIDGALECVGGFEGRVEQCNGLDDDCDDVIDEGELCEGGVCGDAVCSEPCTQQEFPCPVGERCSDENFCEPDPCFDVQCPLGDDGQFQVCVEGECQPACQGVECPDGLVCRESDGSCVPNTCTFLPLCEDDEVCIDAECVSDPCAGVTCGDAEFCRDGACVATCADVPCRAGEICRDGSCTETGCGQSCGSNRVCDEDSGQCVEDRCRSRSCPPGEVCERVSGECVIDPCIGVECPADQECYFGNCYAAGRTPDQIPDAPEIEFVQPAGGGGCAVGGRGDGAGAGWLVAIVVGLLATRGRRRRGGGRGQSYARLGLMLALLVVAAGCDTNPFGISGEVPSGDGDGDGTVGDGDGDGDLPDAGVPDAPIGCDGGVVRVEQCDDLDNDCDGRVDEDFDFDEDFLNCGACGNSCELAGTRTRCTDGGCELVECRPGNVDLNGDLDLPFGESDGCEYGCFVSNDMVEACDGLDNDCDGELDEDTDFDADPNNCGECRRVCVIFRADTQCTGGDCQLVRCQDGFFDINGDPADGCEYACTVAGAEICNLEDEDCDGRVDEDFDVDNNPANCGQCGRVCTFPNATASCVTGNCTFNPATDCNPGFHDVNGNPLDGCEYACVATGAEVCDGADNDCNGAVDDNPVDAGGACNAAPSGTATGVCTDTGTVVCSLGGLVCTGAPAPAAETCDDEDDDCDNATDEGVTQSCYTGPAMTEGVGVCVGGLQTCTGGVFGGACVGEVTPAVTETCDNDDDDCDGSVDEADGGGPIEQPCYSADPSTLGQGLCVAGTETCRFGAFGVCVGEVIPQATDRCGDGLDTDCDGDDDAAEGCLTTLETEVRIDAAGGALGTDPGAQHSFDLEVAAGGNPLGSRIHAVWADLSNGNSDIYYRRSTDGGATFGDIVNLTADLANAAVKPQVVVAPGATDTVFVVFQSVAGGVRDIRVVRSSDSGATFSAVSDRLDGGEDAFNQSAAASADGTVLSVVWEQLDTGTLTRDVVSRTSTDGGANFEAARVVNAGSGGSPLAGRPQVGITGGGQFVYVWRETRGGDTRDVFAAFSDSPSDAIDPGDETRLDADGGDTRDSDFPLLRVAGDSAYVVWQDISTQPGGGSDVVFVRSLDGGETWSAEAVVDDPVVELSSSFSPDIAIDARTAAAGDDQVYLAWEDRRQGTQVFVARSTDAGATFGAAVRASSSGGDAIAGVTLRPRIAVVGTNALAVTYQNDMGTEIDHVFATTSSDGGASWDFEHTRLDTGIGRALTPRVVRASGSGLSVGAFIGWLDFRAGTQVNGDPFSRRVGR